MKVGKTIMFEKVTRITNIFNNQDNETTENQKNPSNGTIQLQTSEDNKDIEKSEEELVYDWLSENINQIVHELPKKNQTLSSLSKLLLSHEKTKKVTNDGDNHYQYHLVCGTLNDKEHTWIVFGESYEEPCDFIYKRSKKPNSKWIIDLQPLLDNENKKSLILEYNTNQQYVPYGNKTILDVNDYFDTHKNLKNITIYQPNKYSGGSCVQVELSEQDYYFDADILMFLLDSDFINNPYDYVDIMNRDLFKKIIHDVHYIKLLRNINGNDLKIKEYIVQLFNKNKKIDLIPEYYQTMFY